MRSLARAPTSRSILRRLRGSEGAEWNRAFLARPHKAGGLTHRHLEVRGVRRIRHPSDGSPERHAYLLPHSAS